MDRFDHKTLTNISSGRDDDSIYPIYYDNQDCVVVRGNASSASCINGTGFRDGRVLPVDYYYYDNDAGSNFFDVYYSSTRFAVETTMALLSMTLNVLDVNVKTKVVHAKQPLPSFRHDQSLRPHKYARTQ